MEPADENALGRFLRARREQIHPSDVGIPLTKRRRVTGLRREEAARLAGISAEYYLRLEQGRDQHPSDSVLAGLARALLLDDAATAYLFALARPVPRRRPAAEQVERAADGLTELVDAWTSTPAYIQGRLSDVLASNRMARALAPVFTPGVNLVRVAFLDPEVRRLWRDWSEMTEGTVAGLRALSGADRDDPSFARFIAELSGASEEFARLWALHEVRPKDSGRSVILHPVVGELDLRYQKLAQAGTRSGQLLVVYYADPGSLTEQRLAVLRDQRPA
ncbi:helix-turn-helix transcriptional regulator [Leifsonia shinshuensis]|uniref:helix-turn-helix transcriptional regulator n=1 Tax=Leifsonia shinshuensis TaxID=150026 RepID=UPI00285F69BE|nr:helix-turn-helix transcriptional regulator [Leifsonia shinshuensis]MDR6972767.1 transcriptional regulator with XRE-family HTH domain [Leifsonia shinshuensis]